MKTEERFTQKMKEHKQTFGFWMETLLIILEEQIYNLKQKEEK